MWEKLKKAADFVRDVVVVAKDRVVNFVKGFARHFESVGILTLSSLGLATLLAEIPFYVTLPMWIEAPMVIPALSILIIIGLVKLAEYRASRRPLPQHIYA